RLGGSRGGKLNRAEILPQLQSIIRAQFDDETIKISDATVVDDVPDWDSVAHVQIMVAIESRFGILFEPEEYTEFADVGEMIDCIYEKLVRNSPDESIRSKAALGS